MFEFQIYLPEYMLRFMPNLRIKNFQILEIVLLIPEFLTICTHV